MAILDRFKPKAQVPSPASSTVDQEKQPHMMEIGMKQIFRPRIIAMACIVSMGGFIFGYDTGQISGFLEMPNFLQKFGDPQPDGSLGFSNWKSGLIVALVRCNTALYTSKPDMSLAIHWYINGSSYRRTRLR